MAEINELILFWAILVTIVLIIIIILLIKLRRKHDSDIKQQELEIQELDSKLQIRQSKAYSAGAAFTKGQLNEVLAGFALLNEYNQLAVLSSVSKQFSLDLLGIKDDSVDFIEVKLNGSDLTTPENKVKKLIDEKKVEYRIIDSKLPNGFEIQDRKK